MANSTNNPKKCPLIVQCGTLLIFSLLVSNTATAGGVCLAHNNGNAAEPTIGSAVGLPRLKITDLDYQGAFKFGPDQYGISNLQSSRGQLFVENGSVFIEGHPYALAISEFTVPALVNEKSNASLLNTASNVIQTFAPVVARDGVENTGDINWMTGITKIDGKLFVNGINAYDNPPISQETTIVIDNANDLANSTTQGWLQLDGEARSAGWFSPIPLEWQGVLGADYIAGHSGGNTSITSRHSQGPSAYTFNKADLLAANLESPIVSATERQQFDFQRPLNADYVEGNIRPENTSEVTPNSYNLNPLWNQISHAVFGMIVPGTSTYLAVGYNQGMEFGFGYKVTQDTGRLCNGPCPFVAADTASYYWLFDVNDWIRVENGEILASDIRPYSYGILDTGFLDRQGVTAVMGGGSWDASSNTLWLSLKGAGFVGQNSNPPVVVAYKFNHLD